LGQSSEKFDEHERPTAQRSRPEGGDDPNATTRVKPFDLEQLVQKSSGTRPIVTSEQIDRYIKERTAESSDERLTEPEPPAATTSDDPKERETVDALTLQRETVIMKSSSSPGDVQTTAQQIPIDVDLSRMQLATPRPAAGRPVPFAARFGSRFDRRQLTIAGGFVIAMVSALLGFIAGRL
jgi:hypothetical protein